LRDEAVNEALARLTESVNAAYCLVLVSRIPATIIYNATVCGAQINSDPACQGCNEKKLGVGVVEIVEGVYREATCFGAHLAVDAKEVGVALPRLV